jgi:hypothetical protein
MIAVNVQPVEADGAFWVNFNMQGETSRYGPYSEIGEAEAMMNRIVAICRVFHWSTQVAPAAGHKSDGYGRYR